MEKDQFKEFCKKEFESRGFRKIKNMFYLKGSDLLCGIDLQNSLYGSSYYVNFHYFIGDYSHTINYPTYYESDIQGRFVVISKKQTLEGKCYATVLIEYEEYTEDELRVFFSKEFEKKILPPIIQGRKYILDNLDILYFLTLNREDVKQKLQS